METISLKEAQATLPDLIHRLVAGEELVITENDQPVAKLVATAARPRQMSPSDKAEATKNPRELGTMKGTVLSMEHFDDPLEEFEEYM